MRPWLSAWKGHFSKFAEDALMDEVAQTSFAVHAVDIKLRRLSRQSRPALRGDWQ